MCPKATSTRLITALALSRCSGNSYLHGASSSRFERRARAGEKRSNFQIRMKYSGWCQPRMRRVCTRMYGAASMRMAIFRCGSTDRHSSSSVVVHNVLVFVTRVGGRWRPKNSPMSSSPVPSGRRSVRRHALKVKILVCRKIPDASGRSCWRQ